MSNTEKKLHQELVEKILDKLEFFISGNMKNLFKEADEVLFKAAESAKSIALQNSNFEFMNSLRAQKENILKNFIDEFNKYLKPVSESKDLPRKKSHSQNNQLGLIEQDEMDEMVTLRTISSKSEMNLQEELSHLAARFEFLALNNQNIFHAKALKAQYFCDAFQDVIAFTELPSENKLALFKMFGAYFISQLKVLYDEINQLMVYDGILPQIELTGKINKSEDRDRNKGHQEAVDESTEPPENRLDRRGGSGGGHSGGGAQGGSGGGHSGGGAQGGSGGGYSGGGAQGGSAGGHSGGGAQGGSAGGHSGGGTQGGSGGGSPDNLSQHAGAVNQPSTGGGPMSAGMPVAQIRQSIQGFVGGAPSDRSMPAGTAGGGGYYSHGDVLSALSNIQINNELLPNTNLGFDAEAIKKALITAIGDSKGGVVDKRVHQVSEKTIDFIKLIFDAIIDDKGISDTIKTLLLSLQIPIIKAAMIDSEFFVDDRHPARQLLDKLAEAGVGVVDQKDPVFVDVEKIVKTLLRDYKEDISAFEAALIELTELTEEIYRKARNQEETSQKEVQHRHARNIVLQEIRKVTLGKELPAKIRTLVLKVWPSLMFNHYLKNGKANDEWVEMLMMMDKIIDSVQPVSSLADLEDLGFSSDDLISAARKKLNNCHKSKNIIDQVLADLKETYDDLQVSREKLEQAEKEQAEKTPPTEQGAKPVVEPPPAEVVKIVEPEPEPEESAEKIAKRKLENLPDDVQPSSWYIVYNGEDKPVRRLKLAVILIQDATLVFVDHLGNVVIEKDADVFTDELEKGLSGLIMQHSVFDHALNTALNSINN